MGQALGRGGLLSSPAFEPQALPLWRWPEAQGSTGDITGCGLGRHERNMVADFCDWCSWFPGTPDEGGAEKRRRVRAGPGRRGGGGGGSRLPPELEIKAERGQGNYQRREISILLGGSHCGYTLGNLPETRGVTHPGPSSHVCETNFSPRRGGSTVSCLFWSYFWVGEGAKLRVGK